jgi:PAS domain S-box-containing protein
MKDRAIRLVYAGFGAVCVVIALAAAAAFRNIDHAEATSDWVNHTHATVYALDRVLASFVAGDGAARTYVLSGGARELAEARGEFNEMTDHLETLSALTRDDPPVHAQVGELAAMVQRHADATLALIAGREGRNRAGLEQLLQSDPGVETIQEVKRRAAKIRAGQFELLDQRERSAYRQAQTTRWVLGTCLVLDLLLLAAAAWLIRDDIAARRRLAETLQDANLKLEARVAERTRELADANARLTTENLERKWAGQSLEHQLRYNQIIVNAASDLVFVVTKTLAVTRVNPAVMLTTGWNEEEILGQALGERVQGTEDSVQALRSGRELHDQPARVTDQRGRQLAGRFTLLPIRDNDKVVGGVVMLRISEGS